MKLILLCAVSSLMFISCQKKYSCKCTTTLFVQYYYPHDTETVEELPKNITKKKAKQICDNTALQVQANARLLFDDDVQVNTKCELKDY